MKHQVWLFLWFFLGMATYMLKRGYYLITGPNPVANNWRQFVQRCWVPLLVRFALEGVAFWACFSSQLLSAALGYFGWQNYAAAAALVTQFAPMAFFFGHAIDSIADFLVSKVPFVKDVLPQMPPPLKV